MTRKYYLDIARVVATITVVLFHVNAQVNLDGGNFGADFYFTNFVMLIETWAVPVFIMISGVLFLDPNRDVKIKSHIIKIALILLFWGGIIYNVIVTTIINKSFSPSYILIGIYNVLIGKMEYAYQFWYLYIIIGLYSITPVLRAFVKTAPKKQLQAFIAVAFIVFTVLPVICENFSFTDYEIFTKTFCFFGGYSGYYMLGYYLDTYKICKKRFLALSVATVISILIAYIFKIEIFGFVLSEITYSYSSPYTVLVSAFVFCAFQLLSSKNFSQKFLKLLLFLSKHSLGIYILHVMIITGLSKMFGLTPGFAGLPAFVTVPLLVILVFSLSLLGSVTISKIPIVKKFIY
ncbi:membrane protein [Clostridia bacterium]|nr:membrane protein [Clostridia bacterium]